MALAVAPFPDGGTASNPSSFAPASAAPDWHNVVVYGADPTGVQDSTAAFKAAIWGGPVYVPAGTYTLNTAQLNPVTGLHLFGDGFTASIINCTAGGSYFMTFDGTAGLVEDVEISDLAINCTGMDIFFNCYMERCKIIDCQLTQNSANKSIFNVTSGNTLMQECVFSNMEYVNGATRSVEAWHLDFSGAGQACNDNTWDYTGRKIFSSNAGDTSQYWMKLLGAPSGSSGSRGNHFRNMVFELRNGTGGLIHLQNMTQIDLSYITSEDLAANTVGSALILLDGIGASDGCSDVAIRSYSRRGGSNIGNTLPDIKLNSHCVQVTIDTPGTSSGGSNLNVDLQSATPVKVTGAWPAAYTLQNATGVAPATPVAFANLNPTGTASTSQVMMGLGSTVTLTPRGTGKTLVNVTGLISVATGTTTMTVGARFGTGTAPNNGDAGTGSTVGGGVLGIQPPGTTAGTPFGFNAILSLTAGTTYWFDLVMKTGNAADTVTATLVTFTLVEMS